MAVIFSPKGVLRGDRSGEACFTTLLVGRTLPATWPHHARRLQRDAGLLGLQAPDIDTLTAHLLQLAGTQLQRVRIELVAHGGAPQYEPPHATAVRIQSTDMAGLQVLSEPVTLQTLPSSKTPHAPLAACKLPQMAEHWLLRRQAQAAGFGDALLTTAAGLWCEATTANLLIGLENDTIVTPGPRAAALPGTTLAALAEQLPIVPWDMDHNTPIQWMLLLNAIWGARPVAAIDGRTLAEPPAAIVTLARRLTRPPS